MDEPFLPADLEDDDRLSPEEWTIKALIELARQLGVMNDFYYPLVGAAAIIKGTNPVSNPVTPSSET